MRLLLDEHFTPTLAEQLRGRGYDVRAVAQIPHLRSRPDDQVLTFACQEGRAVVSENVLDFMLHHEQWRKGGQLHFGLVLTSAKRFPRTERGFGDLLPALLKMLEDMPAEDALVGSFLWL